VLPLRTPDDEWTNPLYIKVGARFEPAPDAIVIERAQRVIAADFRPGASFVKSTAQVIDFLNLQIGGRSRASALILGHNHPQGGCEPSHADVRITYQLYRTLKMLDVEVLDHIIIAERALSFQERGWMKEPWLALRASELQ
jgi:hypothetical protein